MEIYNLHDVVSPSQLRSAAAAHVRKNAGVTNPRVLSFDPLSGFNPKLIGVVMWIFYIHFRSILGFDYFMLARIVTWSFMLCQIFGNDLDDETDT